jgi:hypothetical protein
MVVSLDLSGCVLCFVLHLNNSHLTSQFTRSQNERRQMGVSESVRQSVSQSFAGRQSTFSGIL